MSTHARRSVLATGMQRLLLPALVFMLAQVAAAADLAGEAELVLVGKEPTSAAFAGAEADGKLQFRLANGSSVAIAADELVRWSYPVSPRVPDELLLLDGTRLCLAPAWAADEALQLNDDVCVATTRLLGRISFRRAEVRAMLFGLPPDDRRRQRALDFLLMSQQGDQDALLSENGDVVAGKLLGLTSAASRGATVKFQSDLGSWELPVERARGVALSLQAAATRTSATYRDLIVTLRDGSRIACQSIAAKEGGLELKSAALGLAPLPRAADVASIQPFGLATYLSDLTPTSTRHVPYLELTWPYRTDRNVLNEPFTVRGRNYLKGIGVHTASRLTYAVPHNAARFAATIAVDDAAEGGGSVAFRVLLRQGKEWHAAFESPPLHAGDRPRHVSVDVNVGAELALVADFADRGDERDYADWLDARFELLR